MVRVCKGGNQGMRARVWRVVLGMTALSVHMWLCLLTHTHTHTQEHRHTLFLIGTFI